MPPNGTFRAIWLTFGAIFLEGQDGIFQTLKCTFFSEPFAIGPVQFSWPRGVAENWFTKPGFWEQFVSFYQEKTAQNTESSLNFLQSGPRKFTKSDFSGLAPIQRVLIFLNFQDFGFCVGPGQSQAKNEFTIGAKMIGKFERLLWRWPLLKLRKRGGVQKYMGNKVPWKTGMLIYLPVTSRPLISLQKEAVLSPCNFATAHLTACILNFYLPWTSRPMKRRTLSQRPRNPLVCICGEKLILDVPKSQCCRHSVWHSWHAPSSLGGPLAKIQHSEHRHDNFWGTCAPISPHTSSSPL